MGYEIERKNADMNINQGKGFMCPVCGAFITPGIDYCPKCGAMPEYDGARGNTYDPYPAISIIVIFWLVILAPLAYWIAEFGTVLNYVIAVPTGIMLLMGVGYLKLAIKTCKKVHIGLFRKFLMFSTPIWTICFASLAMFFIIFDH